MREGLSEERNKFKIRVAATRQRCGRATPGGRKQRGAGAPGNLGQAPVVPDVYG
ncbi:MAG: hypothetical protein ABIJ53_10540 [Verrucomicrobiota bacterium]